MPSARSRSAPALVIGVLGVLAALLLPFAPVLADETVVTWPEAGERPESTTAFFVPYAPAEIHVDVPCRVVRAGAARGAPVTLASSTRPGAASRGFAVVSAAGDVLVQVGGRQVLRVPVPDGECGVRLDAGGSGSTVRIGARTWEFGDRVREVFAFSTDLPPERAAGMTIRARTSTWFESSPSAGKLALIGVQLALAAASLVLLARWRGRRARRVRNSGWWPLDLGMLAVLGAWAVLGPRTPDDGFTEGIVRNALGSGAPTNYFRWENAAEAPFTAVLYLLQPLVALHANPLVLRLPSVLAEFLTWLLLSRAVLPEVLPRHARRRWVRVLLAGALLVWWLPFDLGVRPEPFVALGATAVLACALRRDPLLLGLGALAFGLTVAVNPVGITAAAPLVLVAPRIWRALRRTGAPVGALALLACLAAVGLVAMFADQSWYGVTRATELHRFYGPNVPWFEEIRRYEYLLGFDGEQGGLARRLPVLITLPLLACAAPLLARGRRALAPVPVAFAVALGLLWLTPSKWTHYFGALAGLGAPALVVCAVLVVAARHRFTGVFGAILLVIGISTAFAGRNEWFLHSDYGVPGVDGPLVPLNNPLLWIAVAAVALVLGRRRDALARMPAVLAAAGVAAGVVVMLVSFAVAPLRQAGGYSVGAQGIRELAGQGCGIVDELVTFRDVRALPEAGGADELRGFTAGMPGTWSSSGAGPATTGELTTRWYGLPRLRADQELAVSAAGRTGDGNRLALEFARGGRVLGQRVLDDSATDRRLIRRYPSDRVVPDEPQEHPGRRELSLGAAQVPAGADSVRIRAVDATTDRGGELEVSAPRVRDVVPLRPWLVRGPTYVDWAQVWDAPCVRAAPRVSGGLAEAPGTLLLPPAGLGFDGEAAFLREIGGSFAGVREVGREVPVPTELRGAEREPRQRDWGSVVRVAYPMRRDAYDTTTRAELRWGWEGARTPLG